MGFNFFREFQQAMDDRLKKPPGYVANLMGSIQDVAKPSTQESGQSWYVLSAAIKKFPTLREFVDAYSYQRAPVADIAADSGIAIYPNASTIQPGTAVMFYTAINVAGPTSVPITVTAPGHNIAVYVNDGIQAQGPGQLNASLSVTGGEHFIAVICYGSSAPVTVSVPTDYTLVRGEPTPPAPHLVGNPTVDYLKAANGSYAVEIPWHNDAFASAWQVYRAEAAPIGEIVTFTQLTPQSVRVRVKASVAPSPGELFFTRTFLAGVVQEATSGIEDGHDVTDIDIELDRNASTTDTDWLHNTYMRPTEVYDSIARVTYSGDAVVKYTDTAVRQGHVYMYRVTAFGFITGTTESDFSEPGSVLVDDLSPPGDIVFDENIDIKIINGEIQITFTAPEDDDYRGVKIYVEDATDTTKQTLIGAEQGVPGEKDVLHFRPPFQGRYWFRTFDWSGNIQPVGSGKSIDFDGKSRWARAVQGVLVAKVEDATGKADLRLTVNALAEFYPVTAEFFIDDLDGDALNLDGNGKTVHTFEEDGSVGSGTYPALGNIDLPLSGAKRFWALLTDKDGFETLAYTSADRGAVPDGNVLLDDYLAFPFFTLIYDEDVEEIVITIPKQDGSLYGTVTFTRTSGLQAEGGGVAVYVIGSPNVKLPDHTTASEVALKTDQFRGDYIVEYKAGATTVLMWKGRVNGPSSKTPSLEVRYELDETQKNACDVFVRGYSPTGEKLTVEMKDADDPSVPLWHLVDAQNSQTVRYVDPDQEVGPSDWFRSDVDETQVSDGPAPDVWAQKLNNIPLKQGQTKVIAVRVVGKDSGVPSSWELISMPLSEVPEIDAISMTFDELLDQIHLSATAGAHTKSVRFEFSTDETFATVNLAIEKALLTGNSLTVDKNVVTADRNKMWYGRAIGFNGPMSNDASPNVTGLGGVPVRSSVFIPTLDTNAPQGIVHVDIDFVGKVTLQVTPTNNTLSFAYTISTTGYDLTSVPTAMNFSGTNTVNIDGPTVADGQTVYVVVWFYEKANKGGEKSNPVQDSKKYTASTAPQFDYIYQFRDSSIVSEIRIDFQIRVVDPRNQGGVLKAWVNKNGLTSANPTAASDFTFTIPSTPYEANYANWPAALHDILSNAQTDKIVYFEFVNATGQTTGKKEVKVTTSFIDLGPGGKINPGVIDETKFAASLKPTKVVDTLPGAATDGDVVFLTSDKKLYQWSGGGWKPMVVAGTFDGKLLEGQIADGAISTAKFALGLKPVKIITSLSDAGAQDDVAIYSGDGNLYRYRSGAWTNAIPAATVNGQLIASQIADGAINTAKFAAGLSAVRLVTSLPGSGNIGEVIYLTTDQKLYRWNGSTWISTTAATDITGQLVSAQIGTNAITQTQIADGAISTPKLTANAVTANELAAGSVIAGKIATNAITAGTIAAGAVTAGTLAAGAVTAGTIAAGAVTATEIATRSLTADRIATGTLTGNEIAARTISATNLIAGTLTANEIAAGTITASQIAAHTLTAATIAAGAITSTEIAARAINADRIAVGTLTANEIATRTITANKIVFGTLTGNEIAVGSINADRITANTITAGQIQVGAIKADQIDTGAITAIKIGAGQIDATKLRISQLSDITSDGVNSAGIGIITDGTLRSLSGSYAGQPRYLNLNANGSGTFPYFLRHEQLELKNDGTAVFKGSITLDASGSTFGWSDIRFATSGTQWGQLHTYYASSAQYGVGLELTTGLALYIETDSRGPHARVANGDLWVLNGKYVMPDSSGFNKWTMAFSDAAIGSQTGDTGTGVHWLNFEYNGTSRVRFKWDGKIEVNDVWTYSPEPPKAHSAMTAKDWITWGSKDARKAVWPHKKHGTPHVDHPEVQSRAKKSGRTVEEELAVIDEEYGKSIGTIAIGTANWAHLVMQALDSAKDFDDFKRRLGLKK